MTRDGLNKKISRRAMLKAIAGSAGGVLALSLAACSTQQPPAPAQPTSTPSQGAAPKPAAPTVVSPATKDFNWKKYSGTTLRYLGWNDVWSLSMLPKLPEFEQLTGIKVNWEQLSNEQSRQKVPTELAAKNKDLDLLFVAPDVDCVKYLNAGWLFPFDEYLANPAMIPPDWDPKDFLSGTVKGGVVLGKQVTIPVLVEPMVLMYRKDLFEQKGLKPPATLDQLEEVVSKLHEPPNMYGITMRGSASQAPIPWASFLYNYGGDWLTKDRKPSISSPESIKAMELFAKLSKSYSPPGTTTFGWAESAAMMAQGRAAIHADSSARRSIFDDPKQSKIEGKAGYALFPKGPTGVFRPWVWTGGTAISALSEKKEAAWYFILWSLDKKNQLYTHLKGITSARQSAWDAPQAQEDAKKNPEWVEATRKTMELSDKGINPPVVAVIEVRNRVGEVLLKAIQGLTGDALKAEAEKADKDIVEIMTKTEK